MIIRQEGTALFALYLVCQIIRHGGKIEELIITLMIIVIVVLDANIGRKRR